LAVILGVFLAALVGCALGCGLSLKWMPHCRHAAKSKDWLYEQLGITEAQRPKITRIELQFDSREAELKGALEAANRKLSAAIKEDQSFSPRVAQAVEETHLAMAELQKASLERVFAMEDALTPKQYQRLLELAGQALGD
jgi:Spy/CpxP family protein refolding chaperone